ncbi:WD40 repeat domain-containing serine/threonine protein kinase [Nocardiopsis ganjiahuensis]|uniref:WD40 repeat domain-containing serine/threonine protein kinase n=1 Tax=Nocardiopsis ganjiahuensis TaxID=239984 RepID=UPI00034A4860|nr:WD40 repeat domain-containing serine/threonine protein kinase [Nocardiopsis ganjiahuensis]
MSSSLTEPPERIGPYRIVAPLGSGGMGHVHLALGPADQPVAVKVVRPEFAFEPEFRERFAHEVHRALQVTGGDLPRVLDADTVGPSPWLATEFVPGPSLQELVRRIGALPEPTVRYLGRTIAQTLAHLHASGVVHRDLKPGNVLVAAVGPKVIDLGISRAMDESPGSGAAEFAGTPGYMAPETTRDEASGLAADVFALGAVLVFALTGRGPFGDGHPSAVIYRIGHREPDLNGVPPSLRGLLSACLDKDPTRRPTAAQVLQALGGPVPPAVSASAWLPQTAVAVLDGVEHDHRAALRPFLEARSAPHRSVGGRTLALAGAAAATLVLVAGAGLWAVTGPLDRGGENAAAARKHEPEAEENAAPARREQCDPTVHLAPEYAEAVGTEPSFPDGASSIRFSGDGSVLAVQRRDDVVSLWDWEAGTALADIPIPGEAYRPIVFSPDNCFLGVPSQAGAHVYSLETGEHNVHFEGRSARSLAFSPDGSSVLVSDDTFEDSNGGTYPVDLDSGEVLPRYSSDAGRSLRYSPEGTRLAAMTGYSLTVWDTDSREQLLRSGMLTWNTWNQVAFLDEDTVVGILDDGPVVFDLTSDDDPLLYVPDEEPEGVLAKVEANPKHDLIYGLYISEADEDGGAYISARVWHRSTAEDLTPEYEDRVPFAFMTVHPDGDVIASLSPELDEISILDAVTLEPIETFE